MSVLKKFKVHQTQSFNNNNNKNVNIHQNRKKKKTKTTKRDRLFTVGPMGNFSGSTAAVERR